MAEAENILITLVLFSMIVAGGAVFLTETGSQYSHVINLTDNYTATRRADELEGLNVMEDVDDTVRSMEDKIRGTENATGWGKVTEYGVFFIQGIGGMFFLILDSITIPFKIVNQLYIHLEIPTYVKTGIITIILITFIFIIGRIILKRERTF